MCSLPRHDGARLARPPPAGKPASLRTGVRRACPDDLAHARAWAGSVAGKAGDARPTGEGAFGATAAHRLEADPLRAEAQGRDGRVLEEALWHRLLAPPPEGDRRALHR